jgi:sterol 3beta-glucosyltransferase
MTPTQAFPNPMLPFTDLGLPPSGRDDCLRGEPVPRLYGFSPAVVPKSPDWDANSKVTGYWFLDDEAWVMPPSLRGFLAAGPPPVYVGFGSISSMDPVQTTSMVMEALVVAGQRGILASGWGGLTAAPLAEHVHMLDPAPHDRLFPHAAAIVRHGGAGITAAGLRAGKPTAICPFFGDQPFWGRRVAMLGVGPAPIPFRYLTPESWRTRSCVQSPIPRCTDGLPNSGRGFGRTMAWAGPWS